MIFKVLYKDGNGTRRFGFINASNEINAKAKAGRSGKVSTVISVTKPGKGDERFFKEFSLDSVSAMTIDEIAAKYGHEMQNDAEDVLAGFRKSLPTLFKRAADLLKSEGVKSQKYVAAADRFFAELQRLRKIGMDQKALYSEYLQKMDRTFPKI